MAVDKLEIEVIKTFVNVKPRKLNVKWTLETTFDWPSFPAPVRKKPETEEEEAEEIIRRLKEPPKPRDPMDDIMDELARRIAEDIDKELLASYAKRENRTR